MEMIVSYSIYIFFYQRINLVWLNLEGDLSKGTAILSKMVDKLSRRLEALKLEGDILQESEKLGDDYYEEVNKTRNDIEFFKGKLTRLVISQEEIRSIMVELVE